jgi:hypothetical protein
MHVHRLGNIQPLLLQLLHKSATLSGKLGIIPCIPCYDLFTRDLANDGLQSSVLRHFQQQVNAIIKDALLNALRAHKILEGIEAIRADQNGKPAHLAELSHCPLIVLTAGDNLTSGHIRVLSWRRV